MHAYLFLVGFNEDGPFVDSFLDVSMALGHTAETYQKVVDTAERIGTDPAKLQQLPMYMNSLHMRARVTNRRMHKVITEEPLTIRELDALLQHKQREQTLKTFLRESIV